MKQRRARHLMFEPLESRELLSSSVIAGYTPAQIRRAYSFDQITLPGGATANGQGQTIAIVDAFNDPNIVSDLNVFDSQFGLGAANLQVVNQTGGSALPTTDAGWAGEISLDVEWAHAIAPGAKILLVETNSDSLSDLISGVDYARHATGVSVVSMSWGGSEFFSWYGGESASEVNYDPYFTTPSGHNGVTFVASAGDSGSASGVQWPAISPNVLSVGGTTLYTSDTSGTYYGEAGWSGTNGGFSQVEAEPTYQANVQNTGVRVGPDVSYDADPNTGFAVYDSLAFQGSSGWQEVGGTSAGAPQWAALVAIADQGRALTGQGTLDGKSQMLPALYSLYADPSTTGYSSYANDFHDVSVGGAERHRWYWGGVGQTGYSADFGYDLVTGLGSPVASSIVTSLVGSNASNGGTTTTTGSGSTGSSSGDNSSGDNSGDNSSGGTTTVTTPPPVNLPASPVRAVITSSVPAVATGGDHGTVTVKLTNINNVAFSGPITVKLYASTDGQLSGADVSLKTVTLNAVSLKSHASQMVTLNFTYPMQMLTNRYKLIASVDPTALSASPALAVSKKPVAISAATVDLATSFSSTPVSIDRGQSMTETITLRNIGNVAAVGIFSLNLYGSLDGQLDSSDLLLGSVNGQKINLKPGKSVQVKVRFIAPIDRPGSYDLIAAATSSTSPADSNPKNDIAVARTAS